MQTLVFPYTSNGKCGNRLHGGQKEGGALVTLVKLASNHSIRDVLLSGKCRRPPGFFISRELTMHQPVRS